MAARTLLLKLERGGLIRLPRRQRPSSNGLRNRQAPLVAHATEPIRDALGDLRPLRLSVVESGSADLQLFNCLLRRYHYLGHRNTVGENLRYGTLHSATQTCVITALAVVPRKLLIFRCCLTHLKNSSICQRAL